MNNLLTPRRCNLALHCGAQAVERFELNNVTTPAITDTWHPLSHVKVLEQVEHAIEEQKLRIVHEAHALSKDGARYFGLIQIAASNSDIAFVIGIRNSHDKSLPAGLVAGNQVFVCDNLAFSGEVRISRKHTKGILRDFPILTREAVDKMAHEWTKQVHRIETYKDRMLTDEHAHDIVIRALDAGAITAKKIPAVLSEWRKPRHAEFAPRTVWSLHNAFSEILKTRGGLDTLATSTQRLTRLLDNEFRPSLN